MKNILIILVCSVLLTNCSNRYVLGERCTKADPTSKMFERSWIWAVDKEMSKEDFDNRISKENCPKRIAKKS